MRVKSVSRAALLPLALIAANAIAAPAPLPPAPDSLGPLLATLYERLQIADLVALTKWDSGTPIQDSEREAQVIANAERQAEHYAVGKDDAEQLIAAQIEANKLVQYGLLAAWQAQGKAPDTQRPDLARQIRPRLDELQTRLLAHYAGFSPFRADPACSGWLNQARSQLNNDQLHALALIRATGELCTGKPLHHRVPHRSRELRSLLL